MAESALEVEGWSCPLPLRDSPTIIMGHGGGGQMSAELIEHVFLPAFAGFGEPGPLGDSAVVMLGGARIAMSTDTFVVRPPFFPGGSIGHLAVHGTVNDLAMSGAVPAYLSCAMVLEEGTEIGVVGRVAQDIGDAARARRRRHRHRGHQGRRRGTRRPGLRQHLGYRAGPRRHRDLPGPRWRRRRSDSQRRHRRARYRDHERA